MVNTHIISQEFTCHEPRSLAEAVSLLKTLGPEARVLAGGTDLLVQMKLGKVRTRDLVDISKISELRFLTGEKAAEEVKPIDDIRSTAWYRREVIKVLVRDALKEAWGRAGRARQ